MIRILVDSKFNCAIRRIYSNLLTEILTIKKLFFAQGEVGNAKKVQIFSRHSLFEMKKRNKS